MGQRQLEQSLKSITTIKMAFDLIHAIALRLSLGSRRAPSLFPSQTLLPSFLYDQLPSASFALLLLQALPSIPADKKNGFGSEKDMGRRFLNLVVENARSGLYSLCRIPANHLFYPSTRAAEEATAKSQESFNAYVKEHHGRKHPGLHTLEMLGKLPSPMFKLCRSFETPDRRVISFLRRFPAAFVESIGPEHNHL
uniref:Uncharacterized protein n=1 Tax=Oryza punctata TaxID=4537 RepID=A0A0E0MBN8_ORYPU